MKNHPFLETALFTFDEVLSTGLTEKGALSLLANLKTKGVIVRLRKGLYATINRATKLAAPFILAASSAIFLL